MSSFDSIQHIDDTALCIQRKKRGRGFVFVDEQGKKITDKKLLKRIKSLIIPPMWRKVLICKFDDGHIQATLPDGILKVGSNIFIIRLGKNNVRKKNLR